MKHDKNILVVEDSTELRHLLRDQLQAAGFKVRECEDGFAALDAAAQETFHAVITDYRMPNMNGVEVTTNLRARFPGMLIIGVSFQNINEEFLAAGADAFLLKPYQYQDILTMIR